MLDSGIHELLHGVKTNYLKPMLDQIVEEEVGPKYGTECETCWVHGVPGNIKPDALNLT
jgi:hypothetical protein